MSVPPDRMDELQSPHDLWVAKNLNFLRKRVKRAEKALDQALASTKGGTKASSEQRDRIKRQLDELRRQLSDFATMAPAAFYTPVRDQLDAVQKLLAAWQWDAAEAAIKEGLALVDAQQDQLQRLLTLHERLDVMRRTLDKLRDEAPAQVFAELETGLKALRGKARAQTLVVALQQATTLEQRLDQATQQSAARRTRLQGLQKERGEAQDKLKELDTRGRDIKVATPTLEAVTAALEALKLLNASTEEATLRKAIDDANAGADKTWGPAIKAEEERQQLLARQARLLELAGERDQLLKQFQPERDNALPYYEGEVKKSLKKLGGVLADTGKADVEAAQAALTELHGELNFMVEETDRITRLQKRVRHALESYSAQAEAPPKNDPQWSEVDSACKGLEPELRAPSTEGWATSDAWSVWDPRLLELEELLRCFVVYKGKNDSAARAEAFAEATDGRKTKRNELTKIEHDATPGQRQSVKVALDALALLLDGNDDEELEEEQAREATKQLKVLKALIDEIAQRRETLMAKAAKADSDDGGHSVARHGPDVSEQALKTRLSNGTAPDGVFSPTAKSSRFVSYGEWQKTRDSAYEQAQTDSGVDFGKDFKKAPAPNSQTTFVTTVEHKRKIGEGFRGKPPGVFKAHPKGGGGGTVYASVAPLPDLKKTQTTIEWDGGRWVAKQHFPTD